jgi:peroxiredoxin Q/BCP
LKSFSHYTGLVLGLFGPGSAAENTPKPGDLAPLVEGTDQDGNPWKLADRIGKKRVLLYFYPMDGTSGCTKEACSLRDQMSDFNRGNVEVVGLSFDDPESHRKFIAKYRLNFPLLSDNDGKITDAYSARLRPGCDMNRRVSFLIGVDGRIVHVTDAMEPAVHISEMRTFLT